MEGVRDNGMNQTNGAKGRGGKVFAHRITDEPDGNQKKGGT